MNRTLTLTALGLAMALSSATGALASGKKPGVHATSAYASAAAVTADPRKMSPSGRHQGWCALDASCNGWQAWLDDVHAGKLKDLGYDAQ